MPIQITAEQEITIGQEISVFGEAPSGSFAAVFEDDGETGYFYALDNSINEQPIQDAVHIYNVQNVTDKDKPSLVKIGWSVDSTKVVLLINAYPHAIFDFSARQGYCRTGFPPSPSDGLWSANGHSWVDSAVDLFQ
jgi:hypothetical protein